MTTPPSDPVDLCSVGTCQEQAKYQPGTEYALCEPHAEQLSRLQLRGPQMPKDNDPVNHPSHYTQGGVESIDFIEAKGLNFSRGNAVKYLGRAGHKPEGDLKQELEDLKKAQWYVNREVERVQKLVDALNA